MKWIRSDDPRACIIRGMIYFGLGCYGVYLIAASAPSISAYGIILLGTLGVVINIVSVMKSK